MKHLLITTIAAVVLVGCGSSEADLALIDACELGNIEDVKECLADGANVNAKDNQFGGTPLHAAAGYGQTKIAELLLQKGAEVDSKDDKYGVTPLHYAAFRGQRETAELLISRGADVNAKVEFGSFQGKTPLDAANNRGRTEIVNLLRKHGGKTSEELKAEGK